MAVAIFNSEKHIILLSFINHAAQKSKIIK